MRTRYFQQGGQVESSQDEELMFNAVLGLIGYAASNGEELSTEEALQQAASMYLEDPDQLAQLADTQELVQAGAQVMQESDPETLQQLAQPGALTQVISSLMEQAQVQTAKRGAKLNYIRSLKNECPEGYERAFMKAGGSVCPVCKKKAKIAQKKKDGGEMQKETGGATPTMNSIKQSMKCGGKTHKIVKDEHPAGPLVYQAGKEFGDRVKRGASRVANAVADEARAAGNVIRRGYERATDDIADAATAAGRIYAQPVNFVSGAVGGRYFDPRISGQDVRDVINPVGPMFRSVARGGQRAAQYASDLYDDYINPVQYGEGGMLSADPVKIRTKDGDEYEYPDQKTADRHQELIRRFQQKKPMTDKERKELSEMNRKHQKGTSND